MNADQQHPLSQPTQRVTTNAVNGQYPLAVSAGHVLAPIVWSRLAQITSDQIAPGVFRGEDEVVSGTFHGEDSIPPGTWHGEDSIPPGTWHCEDSHLHELPR